MSESVVTIPADAARVVEGVTIMSGSRPTPEPLSPENAAKLATPADAALLRDGSDMIEDAAELLDECLDESLRAENGRLMLCDSLTTLAARLRALAVEQEREERERAERTARCQECGQPVVPDRKPKNDVCTCDHIRGMHNLYRGYCLTDGCRCNRFADLRSA